MRLIRTDLNLVGEIFPRYSELILTYPNQCESGVTRVYQWYGFLYNAKKFLSRSLPESVSTLSG